LSHAGISINLTTQVFSAVLLDEIQMERLHAEVYHLEFPPGEQGWRHLSSWTRNLGLVGSAAAHQTQIIPEVRNF
jgi:hypothetical protein